MTTAAPHCKLSEHTCKARIITAAARFDGHDAAINALRRLLIERGCEVIHLGHHRSVNELVRAAIQEGVDALAISSYQGGHMGFFGYLLDALHQAKAEHIRVFCGGGGTITPEEADALEQLGVTRVYSAGHHDNLGLAAIADEVIALCQTERTTEAAYPARLFTPTSEALLARALTQLEQDENCFLQGQFSPCPVVGITGTGGAGKSTLLDTLLSSLLQAFPKRRFAVLAIDPSRQRSGGALLGDRIRINSLASERVFFHSFATRQADAAINPALQRAINLVRSSGFDLVLIETAGIGQSSAEIRRVADISLYVMTPEYGSPGQLEKIEMLDWADLVVLNKADRAGSEDALRQIRRQWRYNHPSASDTDAGLPVFACSASQGDGLGVDALLTALCQRLENQARNGWQRPAPISPAATAQPAPIPASRRHYLGEMVQQIQQIKDSNRQRIAAASRACQLFHALQTLEDNHLPPACTPYPEDCLAGDNDSTLARLRQHYNKALATLTAEDLEALENWPQLQQSVRSEHYHYRQREQDHQGENYTSSPAGLAIAKVAMPDYQDWGERLRFLLEENLPGHYPYTAGVFPYRRQDEDPTRMFAGAGSPEQTNRRFHYLVKGQPAARLSTAFDPVTLYGEDPAPQADVRAQVGMSGVSVATLDDMKILYSGIDLLAPSTSVSMTINGPAPILLAQFFHTAIDREVEIYLHSNGLWEQAQRTLQRRHPHHALPHYHGELPAGHGGSGLGLLGISGAELVPADIYANIQSSVLQKLRGTLQADILKEDQAQNECLFDLNFALRLMGDVQQWCIDQEVLHFYTVSVSGYHMAEAGANPITQLAFTLANGFTLLEYFLSRGLDINAAASQMSFFFSNAMDPEYAVIGRVARRLWARILKTRYQASPRAQCFKYHIQTSGRSLQSRDLDLNDVRTTLEALYAMLDNCNSLHTNAYDEAITTPTEASVRRALGIQLILQKEFGLNLNQNVLQGAYYITDLTEAVEQAVLELFEALDERGGVFGAMETGFQRDRIQQESLLYERRKQDGSQPIVGVNCFAGADDTTTTAAPPLTRISEAEQQARVQTVALFRDRHSATAPAALKTLKTRLRQGDNAFAALMAAVPCCTLGQLTQALYEVGGHYRRRL